MKQYTGYEYIQIDVANAYGLDRLTFDDRIHWVNDVRPDLLELSELAKDQLAFDKAVRALLAADNGQAGTNHTMGLDATASGLQIMAAMSGCRRTATATNLIPTGRRECVYQLMAETMTKKLGQEVERDTIKHPVMTYFYGSEAVPKSVFGEGEGLRAFYATLREALPGPFELMRLFQSFWDPHATKYEWAMPDGHVCHIPVTDLVDHGVEIDEADHLRFTFRSLDQKAKKDGRAMAANIVHAVDGWICRQMVLRAHGLGFHIAPIHDCFYAHPERMNTVRQLYVDLMVEVAEMNLVQNILSQLSGHTHVYHKMNAKLPGEIAGAEYALS